MNLAYQAADPFLIAVSVGCSFERRLKIGQRRLGAPGETGGIQHQTARTWAASMTMHQWARVLLLPVAGNRVPADPTLPATWLEGVKDVHLCQTIASPTALVRGIPWLVWKYGNIVAESVSVVYRIMVTLAEIGDWVSGTGDWILDIWEPVF